VTLGHVVNAIAQLLNVLGMVEARLSLFIFGLLWLLFHAAFQFGRILFVQPMSGDAVSRTPLSDSRSTQDRHHSA
jgi:hypothetical protein